MTSDRPGRPHRRDQQRGPERGPVLETARLLGLQLLAVVGIATLIVVIVALVGPDDRTSTSTAADGSGSTPAATSSTASTRSSTTGSSGASTSSSAPATTTSSAAQPVATATPDLAKVDVLNQSAPGGSAQKVADQLQRAGWRVGRVSDFHGNISTTTVYWLTTDRRRQARQIARNLGGVRVERGFSTLMRGRITVILVDRL
jgi:hypothetical protein